MFFSYRKFLDPNATDTGSTTTETPSIASMMAKSGVVNTTDTPVATPIVNTTSTDTSEPASTAAPAATATAAKSAETENTGAPSSTETKETTQKETPKEVSWQEVLKSQQPDAILKELGFDEKTANFLKGKKGIDEKMLNFFSHWEENNGDVTKYLKELSTDYTKMPAEDVMRRHLQAEYPKATEKQIDALFKKQVLEYYKVDPNMWSEDEVAEGRLLLEAEADKHRDKFVNEQQQFLMPKPQVQEGPDLQQKEAELLYGSYQESITKNQAIKDLTSSKTITIGKGDEAYNMQIPFADEIVNELSTEIATLIAVGRINKDTKLPDNFIQQRIMQYSFAKNPEAFIDAIAEHYKTIGGKKAIEPIENAKITTSIQTAKAEGTTDNPASAMAKGGRLVSGG